MAFIYVITNDVNGKQYVGKTNFSVEKRFKEHILDSRRKRCEKRPLYNAINKYGVDHFSIKQLEECSAEDSAKREEYWIAKLNTYGHNGYNATRGGDSKKYYDYQKIANKYLELNNITQTADFFHCDIATVKAACKEFNITTLSAAEISKRNNSISVIMLDKNTQKEIKYFDSITEAALYLGKKNKARHIREVLNNKRKSAYGYKWAYAD